MRDVILNEIVEGLGEIIESYKENGSIPEKNSQELLSKVDAFISSNIKRALDAGIEIADIIKGASKFFSGFTKPTVTPDGVVLERKIIGDLAISRRFGSGLEFDIGYEIDKKQFLKDKDKLLEFIIDYLSRGVENKINAINEEIEDLKGVEALGDFRSTLADLGFEFAILNLEGSKIKIEFVSAIILNKKDIEQSRRHINEYISSMPCDLNVEFVIMSEIKKMVIRVEPKGCSSFGILAPLNDDMTINRDYTKIKGFNSVENMVAQVMGKFKKPKTKNKNKDDKYWFSSFKNKGSD
jgi:hypothetical protein